MRFNNETFSLCHWRAPKAPYLALSDFYKFTILIAQCGGTCAGKPGDQNCYNFLFFFEKSVAGLRMSKNCDFYVKTMLLYSVIHFFEFRFFASEVT